MDTSRPIMLTGVTGQVGGDLLPLLRRFGEVVAPDQVELDFSDPEKMRRFIRSVQPRWIVNPAAYTAVDQAEGARDVAFCVNAEAPRVLGEEAARIGAPVLHFSTDYVFAGDGERPWREDDPTGPLGVYGASKLAGEQALAATGAAHVIFRTSWVYATHSKNFLLTILRLAREKETMSIVADQHGAPTWSRDLARLVVHTIGLTEAKAASSGQSLAGALEPLSGIYHACGAGETTWFGFASEFLRLAREMEPDQRFAMLKGINTADYPTPARRPANSRMDCTKLREILGFEMPAWQQSTAAVMREVLAAEPAAAATAR